MMKVYMSEQAYNISPTKIIGEGGEATIYNMGNNLAFKVFKQPTHPDFVGSIQEQQAVSARLAEHQHKLKQFPSGLPQTVITPQQLISDKNNQIIGYAMQLLENSTMLMHYSEKSWRQISIDNKDVLKIFINLYQTVIGVHKLNLVIGDFNDLNVLIKDEIPYLIDADSWQFGKYLCRVFSAKFVDPLLCDPKADSLSLIKPHNELSDWYAFSVMLMNCLLFVDPYGGVYKPSNKNKRLKHHLRPLQRITVFDPEVVYPKPAMPYSILPDELLDYFWQVFVKDKRQIMPEQILQGIRFTKCSNCGTEHARVNCPNCANVNEVAIKQTTIVRGKVIATRVFKTKGIIIYAKSDKGIMQLLYHEDNKFKRENGMTVVEGDIVQGMRFRIKGDTSYIGYGGLLMEFDAPSDLQNKIALDSFRNLPIFDTNTIHTYWINNGQLLRDGKFGQEFIGEVLNNQTLFWVGEKFGFGFYRAGQLTTAFVFNALSRGLKDTVKIPHIKGQLIDSTCIFASDYCWFFISTKQGSDIINNCYVINSNGDLIASTQALASDNTWLSSLRGKCALGKAIFSSTDEGIIKLEVNNGVISITNKYPDTESFVSLASNLFVGRDGIYVVNKNTVTLIKLI